MVRTEAIAPDTADDPGIKACFDYWQTCRGEAFAPRWTDFRLYDLPSRTLPYLLVLDVLRDPLTFVYRYWGTGHTQYHHRDYTGKSLVDMADPWSGDLLTRQYSQVLEERRPLVFLNSYKGVEEPLRSLRMPLSEDGDTVTHMVSYVGRKGVTENMKRLFKQSA